MTCPNCDLSGWHVEAGEKDYFIVSPEGSKWARVPKSYQGGAQERAHLIAAAMQASIASDDPKILYARAKARGF